MGKGHWVYISTQGFDKKIKSTREKKKEGGGHHKRGDPAFLLNWGGESQRVPGGGQDSTESKGQNGSHWVTT